MARCHLTMCRWWAWGCQQHETGTTLSLARQLQTSCCYTSSLAQHFISKNTQEGATHSDVKSWEAESVWLDKTWWTGQEIRRCQRLYRFFCSLFQLLIKLMTQEKDFLIPFIRILTQTYWKKHETSLVQVSISPLFTIQWNQNIETSATRFRRLNSSRAIAAPPADGPNRGGADDWRRKRNHQRGIKQINKPSVKSCDFIFMHPKLGSFHFHNRSITGKKKHLFC